MRFVIIKGGRIFPETNYRLQSTIMVEITGKRNRHNHLEEEAKKEARNKKA